MTISKGKAALARVVAAEGTMGIKRRSLPASVRGDYDVARKAGLLVSAGLETSSKAGDWLAGAEGERAVDDARAAMRDVARGSVAGPIGRTGRR